MKSSDEELLPRAFDIHSIDQVAIQLIAKDVDTGFSEAWASICWEGQTYCLSLAGVETYSGWVKADETVISLDPDVFSKIEIIARDGEYL